MKLYTTTEAAQKLNISVARVNALIVAGRLPATRHGRDYAITETDLANYRPRKQGRPRRTESA